MHSYGLGRTNYLSEIKPQTVCGMTPRHRPVAPSAPEGASPGGDRQAGTRRPIGFRGPPLYLFAGGLLALLAAPLLPWFDFPPVGPLPPWVGLFWFFERGYGAGVYLELYFTGVALTVLAVAVVRRPVVIQGVLPLVFPVTLFSVYAAVSLLNYASYPEPFAPGIFVTLLGSVALEASYASYRSEGDRLRGSVAAHESRASLRRTMVIESVAYFLCSTAAIVLVGYILYSYPGPFSGPEFYALIAIPFVLLVAMIVAAHLMLQRNRRRRRALVQDESATPA